jgi:hypothetical protein
VVRPVRPCQDAAGRAGQAALRFRQARRIAGKLAALPDVQEALLKGGGKPLGLVGEDARSVVRRDTERWTALVKTMGIRAE